MTIQHAAIDDPDIHEPKGVSTASAGKIYIADGSGSGDWTYPTGNSYAEIYIDAGATTQTINSVAGTYDKLNPTAEWTENVAEGLTTTAADGTITLTKAGTYQISFFITFITASLAAGTKYRFKYALDGTTGSRILTAQKSSAGVDALTISAQGLVQVTANQVLSIYVTGDATSANTLITPIDAGLIAVFIKEA
jgi:hypothetical protein